MTTLTLPIVVGKKYVRRDGKVIETTPSRHGDDWVRVDHDEPEETNECSVRVNHGGVWSIGETMHDLVSDYIEPAKGHPHAALMAQFADDASKSETPWDQWQMLDTHGEWFDMTRPPEWHITSHYRRRPKTTPDPHAENAAEYAKDMAETDKAWERWEYQHNNGCFWERLNCHPIWNRDLSYRRKDQS